MNKSSLLPSAAELACFFNALDDIYTRVIAPMGCPEPYPHLFISDFLLRAVRQKLMAVLPPIESFRHVGLGGAAHSSEILTNFYWSVHDSYQANAKAIA
jgi:hypothetical protein